MLDSCDHWWKIQSIQSSCWSTRNNSFWASSTKHPLFFPLNNVCIQNCDIFQPSHLENSSRQPKSAAGNTTSSPMSCWKQAHKYIVRSSRRATRQSPRTGKSPGIAAHPSLSQPSHPGPYQLTARVWSYFQLYDFFGLLIFGVVFFLYFPVIWNVASIIITNTTVAT